MSLQSEVKKIPDFYVLLPTKVYISAHNFCSFSPHSLQISVRSQNKGIANQLFPSPLTKATKKSLMTPHKTVNVASVPSNNALKPPATRRDVGTSSPVPHQAVLSPRLVRATIMESPVAPLLPSRQASAPIRKGFEKTPTLPFKALTQKVPVAYKV